MKIMLGSTGRGGEQAVITPIIKKYRELYPEAHIHYVLCKQFNSMWTNNKDINEIGNVNYDTGPNTGNPVQSMIDYLNIHGKDYDIVENMSDKGPLSKSIFRNCYDMIKDKRFEFEDVVKGSIFYPSDEEKETVAAMHEKMTVSNLILISHVANSAFVQQIDFSSMAKQLGKYGEVAYTGSSGRYRMKKDPDIDNAIDLRGITYNEMYELSKGVKGIICMDSAPAYIVSGSHGDLIQLRNNKLFPASNTGLINMGWRSSENTFEINCHGNNNVVKNVIEKAEEWWA